MLLEIDTLWIMGSTIRVWSLYFCHTCIRFDSSVLPFCVAVFEPGSIGTTAVRRRHGILLCYLLYGLLLVVRPARMVKYFTVRRRQQQW